jgi:hypothetical protein
VNFSVSSARRAIRYLKRGVVPPDNIEHFTVGRGAETGVLKGALLDGRNGEQQHLFVENSYGMGKSHALLLTEDLALKEGFAVARVTVDRVAHPFNHPTRYLHALAESILLPGFDGQGLAAACAHWLSHADTRDALVKWASHTPVAALGWPLRKMANPPAENAPVEDWHLNLLEGRDLQYRNGSRYFSEVFQRMSAMTTLVRVCGLAGIVWLFDEVESVGTLLHNVRSRLLAYEVLEHFTEKKRFPHNLFVFAITPDFGEKLHSEANYYRAYEHAYPVGFRFSRRWIDGQVSRLRLKAITRSDNAILLGRIADVHEQAYDWSIGAERSQVIDIFLNGATRAFQQRTLVRGFVDFLERTQQHGDLARALRPTSTGDKVP